METEFDTEVSGAETVDTSTEIPQQDTPDTGIASEPTEIQSEQTDKDQPEATAAPFSAGKEKFQVNGQEVEWDWDTTKRYAQMGFAAHSKFEQAAGIEKKAKETFSNLVQAAKEDPEGLLKLLNPSFTGFKTATAKTGDEVTEATGTDADPRDEKISQLEQRLSRYEEGIEKQAIAEERKAIESELDAAVKAYPVLGNKIYRDYVKQQYAAALKKGMDVTLDDVAFHVKNDIEMQRQAEAKAKQEKIQANRQKAPVTTVGGAAGKDKPMSREDVMRLAGRIV